MRKLAKSAPSLPRPGSTVLPGAAPVRKLPSALARRFNQICLGAMAEALDPHRLASLHYALMAYLRDEKEIDQIGLAERLGVDRTNIGVLIAELEERGWVGRRADPEDARVKLVSLTPEGTRFHASLSQQMLAVQQGILDAGLTKKEGELLLDLLVRVIQANGKFARPGAGRRKSKRR